MKQLAPLSFLLTLGLLIFFGCKQDPYAAVKSAAGDNFRELEAVIRHFKNEPMKQQAAQFLIRNMLHRYPTSKAITEYRETLMQSNQTLDSDSLWNELKTRSGTSDLTYIYDAAVLSSDYLIGNIDQAFEAWESAPWFEQVDFETFCQYILPYRVTDEAPTEWRNMLREKYLPLLDGITDPVEAYGKIYIEIFTSFIKWDLDYPYMRDLYLLNETMEGVCADRSVYITSVMRALGIPAAYDFVQYWANFTPRGHSWSSYVMNGDRTANMIQTDSIPTEFREIDAAHFHSPRAYDNLNIPFTVDSIKHVSKVFRRMFEVQQDVVDTYDEDTPTFFRDYFVKDVSKSYGLRNSVRIPSAKHNKNGYLFTFAASLNWQPAAKTPRKQSALFFQNINHGIVYLPGVFENRQIVPLSNPFLLLEDNTPHYFNPDTKRRERIVVRRKHVLFGYWIDRWSQFQGGRFEVSNDPDFKKVELLGEVVNIPTGVTRMNFTQSRPYRYIRFLAREDAIPSFAEIAFWGKNPAGEIVSIDGEIIHDKIPVNEVEKALDGDYLTYFRVLQYSENLLTTPQMNYWFGFDQGADNWNEALSVEFCPRHDMNMIETGDDYELFYYDMGWNSLGRELAVTDSLVYDNVPSGALLWLKNHTKGVEERIFTYENGIQNWW